MTGEPAKGPVDISHTNIKTQNRSLTCLDINILWHMNQKILRHNLIVYNFESEILLLQPKKLFTRLQNQNQ